MTDRNLLVLVLDDGFERPLQHALSSREEDARHVRVVAPVQVTPLRWIATDEDEARAEAAGRILQTQWVLAGNADVKGQTSEADPVLAVEDALRTFPADEILLVADPDASGGLEESLHRFGLPVERVPETAQEPERATLREFVRAVAGGRSEATLLVLFAGVNLVLLSLAGLVALVVTLFLLLR